MLKKDLALKLILGLWILCLLSGGIYIGFFADREQAFSQSENRMLAAFPEASAKDIADSSFMDSLEGYFLDHFPGRDRTIAFAQALRDGVSFADYEDYIAVMSVEDDPLANQLSSQPAEQDEAAPPPPPPPPAAAAPPTTPPSLSALPPEESPDAPPETADSARQVVFPHKEEPDEEDFPQTMGVFMQANSNRTALRSYRRSQIIRFTGVLNRFADILPEGGTLSFTMVPQSSYANRFVNANGREALYSDFEQCVYAFSRDNVFVTSTANILGNAIMRGEYVYFRTYMHWTPYGTYLVYSEIAGAIGHVPTPYEDFESTVESPFLGTYYRDNPTGYMRNNADDLELLRPRVPYEFLRVTAPGETRSIPLLNENARANDRYTVYLGGPAGPWSILRSENGMTENCLVLTDSFGLAFVPLLSGQYREVHYYDPRYFNAATAGGSVRELMELYDIKDVFVVVGDLHSFNSDFIYQAESQLG